MYIVGGFDGHTCLDSAEQYNPVTDQWSRLQNMSSARSGVSLVTFQDNIYALGGFDGQDRLQSGLYFLVKYHDIETGMYRCTFSTSKFIFS